MTIRPHGQAPALPGAEAGPLPAILREHDGHARLWGRGSLVTTKLTAEDTRGTVGVTHFRAVRGERAPRHIHTFEDELFVITGGTLTVSAGDRSEVVDGSGVLFLPRGIPHSYQVESDSAQFYVITLPGGFERFFMNAGYPVDDTALVGDRWSVARTREMSESLGLGLVWCE
ncbi:cupin domain-containing protein [Microbispora sp. NPDC004025]